MKGSTTPLVGGKNCVGVIVTIFVQLSEEFWGIQSPDELIVASQMVCRGNSNLTYCFHITQAVSGPSGEKIQLILFF